MCEQYRHLLIARDTAFVPRATQVSSFLSKIRQLGVLSSDAEIVLRTPSERVRRVTNPFTGEEISIPCKDTCTVADFAAFEMSAGVLSDYEVETSSQWTPRLPPIPIEFADSYFIGITCVVSSVSRSTSHYVSDAEPVLDVVEFGAPIEAVVPAGIFTNPHDGSIIRVPAAGSARFWVEIELGKFLFPTLSDDSLDILAPKIVESAEDIFGIRFAQGCYWS
jgi:hypothetical protein